MSQTTHAGPTFSSKLNVDFDRTLKKRVRDYFKENNISKHANSEMVFKTITILAIYIVPFILMLTGVISNGWLILLCWCVMGIGMAGIGMSIMHDANHGAYSKYETLNKVIGAVIVLVGGYTANWKIQHNILHHSYTNIEGFDEDISAPGGLLRFSPASKLKKVHRYQHWYAWFFYALLTVSWSTNKDFAQLVRYKKLGLITTLNKKYITLLTELILNKLIYFGIIVALPIIFIDLPWWQTVLMILIMHFIAGIILSTVFQLAHIIPDTNFPMANEENKVENNWSVHQLETTANFAPKSRILNWFVGGLNFQVEHHLFPSICHVHYRSLSKIVRATAQEFGIPYHSEPTFTAALVNHTRMLKKLGQIN